MLRQKKLQPALMLFIIPLRFPTPETVALREEKAIMLQLYYIGKIIPFA